MRNHLSIREIQPGDVSRLVDYWILAEPDFLIGMGADPAKLPGREALSKMLREQIATPFEQKRSYALIWLMDEEAVGHTNVNKIVFGEEAFMHLHLWQADHRRRGVGSELVKLSLPFFFDKLQLQQLYCEPYALNPAPNKTLEKIGFEFEKEYVTIPGSINFEQPVKRWRLSKERFEKLIARQN